MISDEFYLSVSNGEIKDLQLLGWSDVVDVFYAS